MMDFWTTSRITLRIEGPGYKGGARIEVEEPYALLGRGSSATVQLQDLDPWVCYIHVTDEGAFFVDLQSKVKFTSDGQVVSRGWLPLGVPLKIGPYQIELVDCDTANGVPPITMGPDLTKTPTRSNDHPHVQLKRENMGVLTIGREISFFGHDPICRLQVASTLGVISRIHAALINARQGFWVLNLSHGGKVKVQRREVEVNKLKDGDLLSLAGLHFTYHQPQIDLEKDEVDESDRISLPGSADSLYRPLVEPARQDKVDLSESAIQPVKPDETESESESQVMPASPNSSQLRDRLASLRSKLDEIKKKNTTLQKDLQNPEE